MRRLNLNVRRSPHRLRFFNAESLKFGLLGSAGQVPQRIRVLNPGNLPGTPHPRKLRGPMTPPGKNEFSQRIKNYDRNETDDSVASG